jgi:outer membrane protein assembly complex protein YaeT
MLLSWQKVAKNCLHIANRCVLTLFAACLSPLAAQTSFEGLRVAEVRFQPELQPLRSEELRQIMGIEPGDVLTAESVRRAIGSVFQSGRYLDISIDGERQGDAVVLTVLTKPTWFVGRVTVEGVPEPPNPGQLANASKLQLGREFEQADLVTATDSIQERLRQNGFYEAKITPLISYQPEIQQVNITFEVDPGQRAKFAKPIIEGLAPKEMKRAESATKWKRIWGLLGWKNMSETALQQGLDGIRELYRKDDFMMVRVRLKELRYSAPDRTATPAITVELMPKVEVKLEGAKVSDGKLRELIPVFQEQTVDRDLLMEGTRNLTEYFQSKGYFDVEVTFQRLPEKDGAETVLFVVALGDKHKLTAIALDGNSYFDNATLRERMNVSPSTKVRDRTGRYSDRLIEADRNSIADLYRANGFPDVTVSEGAPVDEGQDGEHRRSITVRINEGAQWSIANVQLEGVSDENREYLLAQMSTVEGQPFSVNNVFTDRDAILNYYFNSGYQHASMEEPELEKNETERSVRVRFVVDEGPRQFVRGFIIGGLRTSNPKLVSSRIRPRTGDPLSQSTLIENQRRLYDLGVFARVDMAQQNPLGNENRKYVLYQFEEARRYSFNIGLGAELAAGGSNEDKFRFSPRISLGVGRSNMFGVGHTASVQTRYSNIQRRLLANYLAPQFKGNPDTSLSLSFLVDVSEGVRTFTSRRLEGVIQLSQRLTKATTVQGRFAFRRNKVEELNLNINPAEIPIYSQPVRVGIFSSSIIQDRRDDPIESHKGYYSSLDAGIASSVFSSSASFVRLLGRNSSYYRIGRDMVFARTVTAGFIGNLSAGGPSRIPLPERFFSGGASSHRGFPDNYAGPLDLTTGFPIGGSAILMHSAELRFPVYGQNLGAAAFHDMGNVFDRMSSVSLRFRQRDFQNFNYMAHAVGVGIRYRLPIGPVRVDLGYATNPPKYCKVPKEGDPAGTPGCPLAPPGEAQPMGYRLGRLQFHFSLGQTF